MTVILIIALGLSVAVLWDGLIRALPPRPERRQHRD